MDSFPEAAGGRYFQPLEMLIAVWKLSSYELKHHKTTQNLDAFQSVGELWSHYCNARLFPSLPYKDASKM